MLKFELLEEDSILRYDRDRAASLKSTNGEVLIARKDTLPTEPVFLSSGSLYDYVALRVFPLNSLSISVSYIYKPSACPSDFYEELFDNLPELLISRSPVFLLPGF